MDPAITDMSDKAQAMCYHFMELVSRQGDYFNGYVRSAERLKAFLDEYRILTNTSYTVRNSRHQKKTAHSSLDEEEMERAPDMVDVRGR